VFMWYAPITLQEAQDNHRIKLESLKESWIKGKIGIEHSR